MFWEMDGVIYYTGMCIYGAGKMDKVSWGYVKKKHPMFAMFEGADNNLPLTDFRVPFDDAVTYDVEEEGFVYNGSQSFDFDAGATDDNDVPKAEIVNQWKAYHNFIYLNSPNIDYFDGSIDQFRLSTQAAQNLSTKYWCTEGEKAFHLVRYDYINEKWVDAGLKGADGEYAVVDLRTDIRTKATYEKYKTSTAYATINNAFKGDFGKFFKANAKFFMSLESLLFCYCYVLSFLAGTDNSSKNTYFKIDPIKQDMSAQANDDFSAWWLANFGVDFNYAECYIMYMDGDDMDSILPVNNKGNLTKPYYIERLYPYSDDNPTVCLYEGMQNQLFNLVELIYSDEERSSMMNRILTAAQSLVTGDDKLLGLNDNKVSVWGFLHKYFFNIQYYFPKIAYLEQARIRYEFAELMGHLGARSVRPISQSIGSQVENEQQFMEQRVVYMASFAVFGALGNKSGAIGLADSVDEFAFQGAELPDGSPADFVFDVTPHQYIYPCGFDGQTTRPTYQRTSPKQTCKVTVAKGVVGTSDTSMGIRGINYYSDLGDFGVSITTAFVISGKRLTRLANTSKQQFRPTSITINATNCTYVNIYAFGSSIPIDYSKLIRAKTLGTGGYIGNVILPESSNLSAVSLAGSPTAIEINNVPNFKTLSFAVVTRQKNITKIVIGENVGTNTGFSIQKFVESVYSQQISATRKLQHIHVENMAWADVDVAMLDWLSESSICELYGRIGIAEGTNEYQTAVTWNLKNKFIKKFGDIDTGNGDLTLEYRKRNFEASTAKIKGNFFVDDYIVRDKGYNDVETFDFSVTPESTYMNTQTKIQFSLEGGNTSAYSMSADGKLSVNVYQLSDKQNFATINAAVTQYENGSFVTEYVTKKIEIWNRPAQLGDVVYYDGSYSSVDEFDSIGKTVVGVCCYVAPKYTDTTSEHNRGDIVEELFDPKDIQQRIMVSTKRITSQRIFENVTFTGFEWGVYTWDSSQTSNSLFTTNANGSRELLKMNGKDLGEIPSLVDYRNKGMSDALITDSNIRSNEGLGELNDGFLVFPASVMLGDGLAYEESSDFKNRRTIPKDTSSGWITEASDYYKSKANGTNMVNNAYANLLKIISFRNSIIGSNGTSNIDNFKDENGEPMYIGLYKPSSENISPEADNVIDSMITLMTYFRDERKETYLKKWTQLLFPANSVVYEFEPYVKKSETLHIKFRRHNWFLPSGHLNSRLYWYKLKWDDAQQNIFYKAKEKGIIDKFAGGWHPISVRYMHHTAWCVNYDSGRVDMMGKYEHFTTHPVCAF